mmetsp:Transcript_8864/g.32726  ORF Transcript_8864/g.32726 Transcript_8864/m.32726 type:complete len:89 (+) Transcript_8864:2052-2318(+)
MRSNPCKPISDTMIIRGETNPGIMGRSLMEKETEEAIRRVNDYHYLSTIPVSHMPPSAFPEGAVRDRNLYNSLRNSSHRPVRKKDDKE